MCVCVYIVGRAGRICENKKGSVVENPSRDIEEILDPLLRDRGLNIRYGVLRM